ncbi:hypothetical protein R6Q59_007967 [Mikania micrantha]
MSDCLKLSSSRHCEKWYKLASYQVNSTWWDADMLCCCHLKSWSLEQPKVWFFYEHTRLLKIITNSYYIILNQTKPHTSGSSLGSSKVSNKVIAYMFGIDSIFERVE